MALRDLHAEALSILRFKRCFSTVGLWSDPAKDGEHNAHLGKMGRAAACPNADKHMAMCQNELVQEADGHA